MTYEDEKADLHDLTEGQELTAEQVEKLQDLLTEVDDERIERSVGKDINEQVRKGQYDSSLPAGLQPTIQHTLRKLRSTGDAYVAKAEPGQNENARQADVQTVNEVIREKIAAEEPLTKSEQEIISRTTFSKSLAQYFGLQSTPEALGTYEANENGIREIGDDGTGRIFISQLFTVLGNGYDPQSGESTLVIAYRDTRKKERSLSIPRKILADRPAALAAFLQANDFRMGVSIKKDLMATKLKLILELVDAPNVDVIGRTGWVQGENAWAFVRSDMMIGDPAQNGEGANSTRIVIDKSSFGKTKIGVSGDFEKWKSEVAACTIGNSRPTMALAAAFTGPLLRFSPDVETSVLNFYGDTSTGKTTTLRVAGSVWGGDRQSKLGYAHTWNSTDKALLGRAADYNETLLCLDEFKLATPNVVSSIYDMSSGEERGRMQQSGVMRQSRQFRVPIMSSGELTLSEKLHSLRHKSQNQVYGGSTVRFLDVPACPKGGYGIYETLKFGTWLDYREFDTGAELSEHLKEQSARHYGHAGVEFIKYIISDLEGVDGFGENELRDFIAEEVHKFVRDMGLPKDTAEEVRRIAKGFALIAIAGGLASDAKIIPHTGEQVDKAVMDCFQAYISERGGYGKQTGTSATVQLRDYLQINGGRFVEVIGGRSEDGPNITNTAGFRRSGTNRQNDREDWFFFLTSVWRDEIESIAPRAKLCEKLLAMGLLQRSESSARGGTFQDLIRVDGRKVRVYKISARVLELTDDGELPGDDDDSERADFNAGAKCIQGNYYGSELNIVDLQTKRLKR